MSFLLIYDILAEGVKSGNDVTLIYKQLHFIADRTEPLFLLQCSVVRITQAKLWGTVNPELGE